MSEGELVLPLRREIGYRATMKGRMGGTAKKIDGTQWVGNELRISNVDEGRSEGRE